jgi:hypothetical protein
MPILLDKRAAKPLNTSAEWEGRNAEGFDTRDLKEAKTLLEELA